MEYVEKILKAQRTRKRAKALQNKGFRQCEIAVRLGISKQMVDYYLNGRRESKAA